MDERTKEVFNFILSLAVPFFFITSGYFMGIKINKAKNKEEGKLILKSKIIQFVKLYLIWSIIYLPITMYGYVVNERGILYDIFAFFRGFFLVGQNFDSWPLWYLLSTIYALSFIYFILSKIKNKNIRSIIVLSTYILSQIFTFSVNNIENLNGIWSIVAKVISLTIINGRILTGIIYIYWNGNFQI